MLSNLQGPGAILFSVVFSSLYTSALACPTNPTNATEAAPPAAAPEAPAEKLPTFGDTIQIAGAMERTDQDFADGLALDLFSPNNRTLVVQQNLQPLGAQFVSGTTGEGFVALSNYSYIIKTSDGANDLIAKIEIPVEPDMLASMGINQANTYVGILAADKKSWVVNEQTRNVHVSENNTRIIKMTSLDGEFMILGRKSLDTNQIFVQYGQGATRTVNMTGGPGIQEAEFVDGLRFSTQSETPLTMNVDIINGVKPETLPANMKSLNSFAWVVNTSDTNAKVVSQMRVPFNRAMLVALKPTGVSPTTSLIVAKRPLGATTEQFAPLSKDLQVVNELPEDRIAISGMTQLDGEYVIMVN